MQSLALLNTAYLSNAIAVTQNVQKLAPPPHWCGQFFGLRHVPTATYDSHFSWFSRCTMKAVSPVQRAAWGHLDSYLHRAERRSPEENDGSHAPDASNLVPLLLRNSYLPRHRTRSHH